MRYRGTSITWSLRLAIAGAMAACLSVPGLSVSGASAQELIPQDFFNAPFSDGAPTTVEANSLTVDATANAVLATGDVVVGNQGYTITGQNLRFDRDTNSVKFVGPASVIDPSGNIIQSRDVVLEGGMKQAFLNALTVTTYNGARITADSVDYDQAVQTMLANATYAPCGECIDDKGRRIGWSVNASRIVYTAEDGSLYLEQPTLELLGFPVAWLPYLWLPDTSGTALANVRTPRIDSSSQVGLRVEVPYVAYSSEWTEIVLTPTLVSRQGFLLGAEWLQRFDKGEFRIKASGLYQFDRGAFDGEIGDRQWRGAIETTGKFRPDADWTLGYSYTAFTDAAYFDDYLFTGADSLVNEVYATKVTPDTYIDVRLQEFKLLGQVTADEQDQQALALPNARFDHITRLAPGFGRIEVSGRLLGVRREQEQSGVLNGVPYTFGYAGNKTHASFQAGWQNQFIGGGGFVATPYLGGRADVAYYEGNGALPDDTSLWSATPIAAMDVRFPLAGSDGSTVHLVEPIGQLVYRGTGNSTPGITNDDAQSFVFDDTNLFSYNRFSGNDRQETGLRANIGGRYLANFANGDYVEVIAGQSFQLAGNNAFADADQAQTGAGSGLDVTPSYAVLGAYGSFIDGVKFGGKLQVDPNEGEITRAGLGASYGVDGYSAVLDYSFIAANEQAGVLDDQHEIGAEVGVPVADYWTLKTGAYWDLAADKWLQVSAGLEYDDSFLVIGGKVTRTGPTHTSPNDTRFLATFMLKGPPEVVKAP